MTSLASVITFSEKNISGFECLMQSLGFHTATSCSALSGRKIIFMDNDNESQDEISISYRLERDDDDVYFYSIVTKKDKEDGFAYVDLDSISELGYAKARAHSLSKNQAIAAFQLMRKDLDELKGFFLEQNINTEHFLEGERYKEGTHNGLIQLGHKKYVNFYDLVRSEGLY